MPAPKVRDVLPAENAPSSKHPLTGCLVRVLWMFFGNFLLLVLTINIFRSSRGAFSLYDGLYWALIAILCAVRYVDIKALDGQTAEGRPATLAHWKKYAILLFIAGLLLWLGAHGLALVLAK